MTTLDDLGERFDSMEKQNANEHRQLFEKTARIEGVLLVVWIGIGLASMGVAVRYIFS